MRKSLIPISISALILLLKNAWWLFEIGVLEFGFTPCNIRLWGAYCAMVLLMVAPMWISKSYRWTYALHLLLDVWLIGNLVYFRSYGDLLNRWLLSNISAMDGVWGSVFTFVHARDIVFPMLSVVWIVVNEWIERNKECDIRRKGLVASIVAAIVLYTPSMITNYKTEQGFLPFSSYYLDVSMGRIWYAQAYGPYTHLLNEAQALCRENPTPKPISEDELAPYLDEHLTQTDSLNLLVIFVESMEDWVMAEGAESITPHLVQLRDNPYSTSCNVVSEVAHGKSSDAQLIVFTGLLPVYDGAVSMRYANHFFPSWVKNSCAKTKQMFIPTAPGAWNQAAMTKAYGFDELYADEVSDSILADTVVACIEHCERPFVIMHTTMASHAPFRVQPDYPDVQYPEDLDNDRKNYLRCLAYSDRQIGREIHRIMSDSTLCANTRILVMGDHPIFEGQTCVPLIWYDPTWQYTGESGEIFQSDVYRWVVKQAHIPTRWKGLTHDNRNLSDRIIRSDYLKQYENDLQ